LLELGSAARIITFRRVLRDPPDTGEAPAAADIRDRLDHVVALLAAARRTLSEVPGRTRRVALALCVQAEVPRALGQAGGAAADEARALAVAAAFRQAVAAAGQPPGGVDLATTLLEGLEAALTRVTEALPVRRGPQGLPVGVRAMVEALACVWSALRGEAPTLMDKRGSFLEFAETFAPRFGRSISRAEAATEVRRLKKLLQQCPAFLQPANRPHAEGMGRAEIAQGGRGFSREGP
jgi:hypothetical protein